MAVSPYPAIYHGGSVIRDPKVHLVVWGPRYPAATETAAQHLLRGLRGSAFGAVLAEYYDTTGHVHDDIQLTGTWTDPTPSPTSVTSAQIRTETGHAIHAAHWKLDANTIIVVLLSPHVRADTCGFHLAAHSVFHGKPPAIAVVPYPSNDCDFGFGISSDVTYATSHELAESITDPFDTGSPGSAWWNIGGPPLGEAADACESTTPNPSVMRLSDGGSAAVADLYSPDRNKCVTFS